MDGKGWSDNGSGSCCLCGGGSGEPGNVNGLPSTNGSCDLSSVFRLDDDTGGFGVDATLPRIMRAQSSVVGSERRNPKRRQSILFALDRVEARHHLIPGGCGSKPSVLQKLQRFHCLPNILFLLLLAGPGIQMTNLGPFVGPVRLQCCSH